jgi:hypothetical protein
MGRMKLIGMSIVNEGISGKEAKNPNTPYKMQDLHFIGKGKNVEGQMVVKITIDLLKERDLLELEVGADYIVDVSDKGWLRSLEYLNPASDAVNSKRQQINEVVPSKPFKA